eukprot:3362247-Pleurochrysis_carterae.AAC.4
MAQPGRREIARQYFLAAEGVGRCTLVCTLVQVIGSKALPGAERSARSEQRRPWAIIPVQYSAYAKTRKHERGQVFEGCKRRVDLFQQASYAYGYGPSHNLVREQRTFE